MLSAYTPSDHVTPRVSHAALVALAVFVLAALLLPFFYVGFQASDDASYVSGGLGWLERFPYVGDCHWTLRHTITLPVAASVGLLGLSRR
jgi:hypothetical protein